MSYTWEDQRISSGSKKNSKWPVYREKSLKKKRNKRMFEWENVDKGEEAKMNDDWRTIEHGPQIHIQRWKGKRKIGSREQKDFIPNSLDCSVYR